MSLLSICQNVARRTNFEVSGSIVGNTDQLAQQLLALANASGKFHAQKYDWQGLFREAVYDLTQLSVTSITRTGNVATVTTASAHGLITGNVVQISGANQSEYNNTFSIIVTGASTFTVPIADTVTTPATGTITYIPNSYAQPANVKKYLLLTAWDATNHWPLDGPVSPDLWQNYINGILTASIRRLWRLRNNRFEIFPISFTGQSVSPFTQRLALEYSSKNWVLSNSGTEQDSYQSDTDVSVIDEFLIELDVTWRLLSAKTLAYGEQKAEYESYLRSIQGSDQSAGVLDAGDQYHILAVNRPATGYGLPS